MNKYVKNKLVVISINILNIYTKYIFKYLMQK